MKKVKVMIEVQSSRSRSIADFQSGNLSAKEPATPLQTLIEAACHMARTAEIYEGAGDVLALAIGDAVQGVKDRKASAE